MLDITIADAVAVGTITLAIGAAWRGMKGGDFARRHTPSPDTVSVGSTVFADTMAMTLQTAALNRIADAIESTVTEHRESEKDRLTTAIEQLVNKIEHLDDTNKETNKRLTPRRS